MTYELGDVKEDSESAAIPVTFTYVDTPPVFNAVLDEYITQAFALAMTNADDAEIDALFGSVFEEQAQSVKTNTASVDMDFKCVKVDGEWKIAAFSARFAKNAGTICVQIKRNGRNPKRPK